MEDDGWTRVIRRPRRANRALATHGPTEDRNRHPSLPMVPKPRKYDIKVDIYRPNGTTLIASGLDILTLRRFSNAAKAVLTTANTTLDCSQGNVSFTMPRCGGSKEPSTMSILRLFRWMEANAKQRDPHLRLRDIKRTGGDLYDAINVYAACTAIQFSLYLDALETRICTEIQEHPISSRDLKAIIELLPLHHAIVRAAVQSLTFYDEGGKFNAQHKQDLEQVIESNSCILALFRAEQDRQKECQGRPFEEKKKQAAREAELEEVDTMVTRLEIEEAERSNERTENAIVKNDQDAVKRAVAQAKAVFKGLCALHSLLTEDNFVAPFTQLEKFMIRHLTANLATMTGPLYRNRELARECAKDAAQGARKVAYARALKREMIHSGAPEEDAAQMQGSSLRDMLYR